LSLNDSCGDLQSGGSLGALCLDAPPRKKFNSTVANQTEQSVRNLRTTLMDYIIRRILQPFALTNPNSSSAGILDSNGHLRQRKPNFFQLSFVTLIDDSSVSRSDCFYLKIRTVDTGASVIRVRAAWYTREYSNHRSVDMRGFASRAYRSKNSPNQTNADLRGSSDTAVSALRFGNRAVPGTD
jgi:hypothetical protein